MRKLFTLVALVVLVSGAAMAQDHPKAELFGGYSILRVNPGEGLKGGFLPGGWHASIAGNVNHWFGLAGDFSGHYGSPEFGLGLGGIKTRAYPFTFGPRFSYRKSDRLTPFAHAQFGGAHVNALGGGVSQNAFAMNFGGGLDAKINDKFAFRIGQFDYLPTRFDGPVSGNKAWQHNFRFSTGIVFRFGGNPPPPPPPPNRAPVAPCSVDKAMVYAGSGDSAVVRANASDPDNDPLTYTWTTTGGTIDGSGPDVRWNSSGTTPGTYAIKVRVSDSRGGTADCSADIRVEPRPNHPPTMSCSADRDSVFVGQPVQITAMASDPDNDPLTFSWSASAGRVFGSGSSVRFDTSALRPGPYAVTGRADDGRGGAADCSVNVNVQAAPPPAEKELEARLALRSIYFQTARPSASNPNGGLLASQQEVLVSLANDFKKYLALRPEARLILGGHADPRGSIEYNQALTERRVERAKRSLIEQSIPAASIEVRPFGEQGNLSADEVRQLIKENSDLSAEDRQKMLDNLQVIILANNRRVDVTLSTTGQESLRRYPFNAKDALALISIKGEGTVPPAKKKQ